MSLDEPTAFLDLTHKHEITLLLGELAREHGKTIVFSSHDLQLSLKQADKIWLMHKELKHVVSMSAGLFKISRFILLDLSNGMFYPGLDIVHRTIMMLFVFSLWVCIQAEVKKKGGYVEIPACPM